jgi:hypothetical protein
MEHCPDTAQRDTNPAAGALADLRLDTPQQSFDVSPLYPALRRRVAAGALR